MRLRAFGAIAVLLLAVLPAGCGDNASRPAIEQVKDSHEGSIMAIKGVAGVGIGDADGSPVIKVFLENDSPELKSKIPREIEGYRVVTDVTGPIEALPGAPMKGYELYSWQAGGEWFFSVLDGTNRLKTYEEVTAPGVAIKGVDGLVARLGQLAKGAQVTWSPRSISGLSFPPEEVASRVTAAASESGLELSIDY